MTEEEVRLDWFAALDSVEHGEQLSGVIQWGFSQQDLLILGLLHEEDYYGHRKKIEDLLEDCNFHTDCRLLSEGKYDTYRKRNMIEWGEENLPFH